MTCGRARDDRGVADGATFVWVRDGLPSYSRDRGATGPPARYTRTRVAADRVNPSKFYAGSACQMYEYGRRRDLQQQPGTAPTGRRRCSVSKAIGHNERRAFHPGLGRVRTQSRVNGASWWIRMAALGAAICRLLAALVSAPGASTAPTTAERPGNGRRPGAPVRGREVLDWRPAPRYASISAPTAEDPLW
jgi:hypothetical protein